MTIYGKGCISNYRNCSLSYVWYSVLYRMLTVKQQMQMGKNTPYDALLQGSNRNYGTGIRTTDIRQAEFDSGEWKTVLGEFRMFFTLYC